MQGKDPKPTINAAELGLSLKGNKKNLEAMKKYIYWLAGLAPLGLEGTSVEDPTRLESIGLGIAEPLAEAFNKLAPIGKKIGAWGQITIESSDRKKALDVPKAQEPGIDHLNVLPKGWCVGNAFFGDDESRDESSCVFYDAANQPVFTLDLNFKKGIATLTSNKDIPANQYEPYLLSMHFIMDNLNRQFNKDPNKVLNKIQLTKPKPAGEKLLLDGKKILQHGNILRHEEVDATGSSPPPPPPPEDPALVQASEINRLHELVEQFNKQSGETNKKTFENIIEFLRTAKVTHHENALNKLNLLELHKINDDQESELSKLSTNRQYLEPFVGKIAVTKHNNRAIKAIENLSKTNAKLPIFGKILEKLKEKQNQGKFAALSEAIKDAASITESSDDTKKNEEVREIIRLLKQADGIEFDLDAEAALKEKYGIQTINEPSPSLSTPLSTPQIAKEAALTAVQTAPKIHDKLTEIITYKSLDGVILSDEDLKDLEMLKDACGKIDQMTKLCKDGVQVGSVEESPEKYKNAAKEIQAFEDSVARVDGIKKRRPIYTQEKINEFERTLKADKLEIQKTPGAIMKGGKASLGGKIEENEKLLSLMKAKGPGRFATSFNSLINEARAELETAKHKTDFLKHGLEQIPAVAPIFTSPKENLGKPLVPSVTQQEIKMATEAFKKLITKYVKSPIEKQTFQEPVVKEIVPLSQEKGVNALSTKFKQEVSADLRTDIGPLQQLKNWFIDNAKSGVLGNYLKDYMEEEYPTESYRSRNYVSLTVPKPEQEKFSPPKEPEITTFEILMNMLENDEVLPADALQTLFNKIDFSRFTDKDKALLREVLSSRESKAKNTGNHDDLTKSKKFTKYFEDKMMTDRNKKIIDLIKNQIKKNPKGLKNDILTSILKHLEEEDRLINPQPQQPKAYVQSLNLSAAAQSAYEELRLKNKENEEHLAKFENTWSKVSDSLEKIDENNNGLLEFDFDPVSLATPENSPKFMGEIPKGDYTAGRMATGKLRSVLLREVDSNLKIDIQRKGLLGSPPSPKVELERSKDFVVMTVTFETKKERDQMKSILEGVMKGLKTVKAVSTVATGGQAAKRFTLTIEGSDSNAKLIEKALGKKEGKAFVDQYKGQYDALKVGAPPPDLDLGTPPPPPPSESPPPPPPPPTSLETPPTRLKTLSTSLKTPPTSLGTPPPSLETPSPSSIGETYLAEARMVGEYEGHLSSEFNAIDGFVRKKQDTEELIELPGDLQAKIIPSLSSNPKTNVAHIKVKKQGTNNYLNMIFKLTIQRNKWGGGIITLEHADKNKQLSREDSMAQTIIMHDIMHDVIKDRSSGYENIQVALYDKLGVFPKNQKQNYDVLHKKVINLQRAHSSKPPILFSVVVPTKEPPLLPKSRPKSRPTSPRKKKK